MFSMNPSLKMMDMDYIINCKEEREREMENQNDNNLGYQTRCY